MYLRKETHEHEMRHLCTEIHRRENTNADVRIVREYANVFVKDTAQLSSGTARIFLIYLPKTF